MTDMKLFTLPRITFANLLLVLITVVSSGLSGYCGWMLAFEQHVAIKCLSAGAGASIAMLLSINTIRAARYYVAEDKASYISAMRYCLILAVFNWVTDFGAASVMRDHTFVASKNTNIAAQQKLGEVKRIESRIAKINKDLVSYKDTKTPGFYEAELIRLKATLGADARNIWQRSRQCADVTIKESQDHCAEISAAKQGISDAQRKRKLEDERLVLTQQLPQAKAASQVTKQTSNPVVAQIGNFAAFVLLSFEHSDGQIKWGILIFTLLWTSIFSMIIFRESWQDGLAQAARAEPSPIARNPYLADSRPEAAHEAAQGRETIVLQSETIRSEQATDALERALENLRSRYKAETA